MKTINPRTAVRFFNVNRGRWTAAPLYLRNGLEFINAVFTDW